MKRKTPRWVFVVIFCGLFGPPLLIWSVRAFVVAAYYTPSEGMANTFLPGDRVIVSKLNRTPQRGDVLVFAAPPEATGDPHLEADYIKRLIGLPGEKIEIRGATLTVGEESYAPIEDDPRGDVARDAVRDKLGISREKSVKFFKDYVLVEGTQKVTAEELARAWGQPGAKVELTPGVVLINGTPLDEPYTREDPGYSQSAIVAPVGCGFMLGDNRNRSADSHQWGALELSRVRGVVLGTYWRASR